MDFKYIGIGLIGALALAAGWFYVDGLQVRLAAETDRATTLQQSLTDERDRAERLRQDIDRQNSLIVDLRKSQVALTSAINTDRDEIRALPGGTDLAGEQIDRAFDAIRRMQQP